MSIEGLNSNGGYQAAMAPTQTNGVGQEKAVKNTENNNGSVEAITDQAVKMAIDDANRVLSNTTTRCEYAYDEDCKRVSIKIFNCETDEVIKEIPSEERLEAIKKLQELAGLMLDKKL